MSDPARDELRSRCARRARERWLLLDADRLVSRCAPRIAVAEPWPGAEDAWIEARIDEAALELLEEDREGGRELPGLETTASRHAQLARAFAIPPARARACAVRFHALPDRARRAFFALIVEGCSPGECLAMGWRSREELFQDVRAGLLALFPGA